ncbi:hypothetical protein [Pseudomonas abietaniphila]
MEQDPVVLFELDVAVPAQQFRIEYTLVDKGGLPVVPEFLLRLLKVSALLPAEIAKYFGFTAQELSFAITPFLQKGEIKTRPDGRFELTQLGLALFAGNHESPVVKRKEEREQMFVFDLLTFTCLGRSLGGADAKRSMELQAPSETLSESGTKAVNAFMFQIHEIHRSGLLGGQGQDGGPPELYKVGGVQKIRDGWEKVEERVSLDADTRQIRFVAKEGLRENEIYMRQRTEQLSRMLGRDNMDQVLRLADELGDHAAYDYISSSGLDLHALYNSASAVAQVKDSSGLRLFGSIQLQQNWDRVHSVLRKHQKLLQSSSLQAPVTLSWMAPSSHELWGRAGRHAQACSAFAELSKAKGKGGSSDGKPIFDSKILIPLSSNHDWQGKKRAKADCSDAKALLHGFVENDRLAPLEAIIIQGRCAIVLYHLVSPAISPVPVTFGYITEEPGRVLAVEDLINRSMREYVAGNTPRYLGSLERTA